MTAHTPDDLEHLQQEALAALSRATTPQALEAWRVMYLGRKGYVPKFLRTIKELPAAARTVLGQRGNALRAELTALYHEKYQTVMAGHSADATHTPETAPLTKLTALPTVGHLHPLTITIRAIQAIFSRLGFTIVEGPEVEDPQYNFDLLNIPADHPAREDTDTFYTTAGQVLRTHTSPVQLRSVREHNLTPPLKILSPGRVFRAERTDATHETTFHQFEGLVLAKQSSVAELRGTVETFYSHYFGRPANVRLRPSYFPFVEPGFELDIGCIFCEGKGCRICKQSGWIEVMGAGMVHPTVVKNMGFDPETVHGFAFGGAVDRLAMLTYGIDDIRLLWSGDLRFLTQFS